MPDGETNKRKLSAPNILAKLRSFFRFRHLNTKKHERLSDTVENKIDYQKLKAEDVMIPRVDIDAIDYTHSLAEIAQIFLESRHTRMPVYKDHLDNIVGFINIKDLFPYLLTPAKTNKFSIDRTIRKLLIISPSMKIFALLEKMRQTRTHIALVVDELGGVDGLITIEDLVEEFIGEIEDEHDKDDDSFKKISDHCYEVSGRYEVALLEEKLNIKLSEGDKYDTVGGLVLSISGYVPEKGAVIIHKASGLSFEIIESDPRRIKKILISITTHPNE